MMRNALHHDLYDPKSLTLYCPRQEKLSWFCWMTSVFSDFAILHMGTQKWNVLKGPQAAIGRPYLLY